MVFFMSKESNADNANCRSNAYHCIVWTGSVCERFAEFFPESLH